MADDIGRLEPTWRLIYPSLKMRTQRMPSPTRVGDGTWLYIIMQDAGITPFFHTPSSPCKDTLGNKCESLGMDITLDNVLTILDEHYNNVKALDALNQELFQLGMADKETVSDWGLCLSRHLQVLAASFQECFPPNWVASWNATTSTVGYPNILKPWWPTLRPVHRKRLIPITCGLQGKQRRKTPLSYPKALEAKQLITLSNPGWLVLLLVEDQGEPAST